jgi:hypothetical protein
MPLIICHWSYAISGIWHLASDQWHLIALDDQFLMTWMDVASGAAKKKLICHRSYATGHMPYLASGIWHLASGIWHLASGIWHLASGI